MSSRYASLLLLGFVSSMSACGGNVVVDRGGPATGGSGGAGGSGGVGGGSGGAGAAYSCDELEQMLINAFAEAMSCSASVSSPQCTGVAKIYDLCGCPIVANEKNPSAVTIAVTMYSDWEKGGCKPADCQPCKPLPSAWHCAEFGSCEAVFAK